MESRSPRHARRDGHPQKPEEQRLGQSGDPEAGREGEEQGDASRRHGALGHVRPQGPFKPELPVTQMNTLRK